MTLITTKKSHSKECVESVIKSVQIMQGRVENSVGQRDNINPKTAKETLCLTFMTPCHMLDTDSIYCRL